MPTGRPYFAWVEASEATFGAEHLRWDENIFAFQFEQREGEFAALTIEVRNPRIGPLAPGRKIWAWFAFDCGNGNLMKLFGRLIGVPSNLLGEVITFEFVARPSDYEAQKLALAESLKELPYYDRIFFDPQAEEDPDNVLEGYGARFHVDRETHATTTSDELIGEDGTLVFEPEDMLYDGLGMNITGSPASVAVGQVLFSWTQLANGSLDLTEYIVTNWPNEVGNAAVGTITSFTMSADNWPKAGASIGDGWTVVDGSCQNVYDIEVKTSSQSNKTIYNWANGSKTELTSSETREYLKAIGGEFLGQSTVPPGSMDFPSIVTQDEQDTQYGSDGGDGTGSGFASREVVGFSRNYSAALTVIPLLHLRPRLSIAYEADRPFSELVQFNLVSDVQPVLTDPEDGMVIRLSDMRSVNLSETVGEGSDAEVPIIDPRRRSYVTTDRGQSSLRYMLARARAALRRRARVVEITIEPRLERMPDVTLRKNAFVTDTRIPGGSAAGKIISYSLGLDGDSGAVACSVTIGCAVGRGGTVSEVAGTPTYVVADVLGPEVQEFSGRVVHLDDDEDVGFTLPLFDPSDDGIDFFSGVSVDEAIEDALSVANPPAVQRSTILGSPYQSPFAFTLGSTTEQRQQALQGRAEHLQGLLRDNETVATFKLRSMTGEFETGIEIEVTGLKIPKTIDLEAAA